MAEGAREFSISRVFEDVCKDRTHVMCVGGLNKDGETCCDVWNDLNPGDPKLGPKLVDVMNEQGFKDKLDEQEKELIKAWPRHQLEAVVRAIQSVCAVHNQVDPCLSKNKRKGPPAVAILITEPEPTRPKRAPVHIVFEHADFKN